MGKHRALILGAGGAGKTIAGCMREDGRAEPVGFLEPVPEQTAAAAGDFPDAVFGTDYGELLDQLAPDIVVVAGPDHLHAGQAVRALERGCHVLIEKPMATTVADARRVLDAEATSGKHVMVDFTMRYTHPWSTMARAAKAGEVGPIFFLEGNYIHDMWAWYDPAGPYHTPWRIDRDNPQNILLGGGCHGLDLMLWVMQDVPVREVFCYTNHLSGSNLPIDDCLLVSMQFEGGVIGKVLVTSGCNGAPFAGMLAVYGRDGTIDGGTLYRRDAEPVELADPSALQGAGGHGWPGAVADFLNVLDGSIENPIPSVMGARNVAVCEAALRSAEPGGPQPVEWF